MVVQVLSLLDNRLLPIDTLHNHDAMANLTTATSPGNRDNGVVHPLHTMGCGAYCDKY
jgi:hypothetical protein